MESATITKDEAATLRLTEIEDAAARELREETGLADVVLEQMHTFGNVGRDPRGRQIAIAFWGIATKRLDKIKGSDDATRARWFDIEKLPEDLAFDHTQMTKFAVRKLKRKKIYRLSIK